MKQNQKNVAIITGASRGIGATVAEALAGDGYIVALVARSEDALEQLSKKIIASGKKSSDVVVYPLDVQDHEAIKKMVNDVHQKFGRIDLLFNNAGKDMFGTEEVPIEDFDSTIATNLRGPFSFVQAVVPIMKTQHGGYIINVASKAGKTGYADWGVYGASKFALVGFSESLYRKFSRFGIKVTALCPGWVDTDMGKESGLKSKEMISKEDIATTLRWLLSLSPAAVVREIVIECRTSLD